MDETPLPATGWRRALPDWPERRYTVHAGTNLWGDWWRAWPGLVAAGPVVPALRAFEAEAARRCGCRYAVAFGAGRMALHAALGALALGAGDEVIVPGFTCAVVPNAMLYRQIRPVWVDIEARTFNLDPERVEAAITGRTRAIYLQHTFGVSADAKRLRDIAQRHGLLLIEDAAHSLGASVQGQLHGSLGDVGFFSTDRTKVINTHLGGCAVTNNPAIAARLQRAQQQAAVLSPGLQRRIVFSFLSEFALRDPHVFWLGRPLLGALRRCGMNFSWSDEAMDSLPPAYPYPSQLGAVQARLGLAQLRGLDNNLQHRRCVAEWLEARIGWYSETLTASERAEQSWLRYSFLVRDRAAFVGRFGSHIDLGIWFPSVIFGREGREAAVGYAAGRCPVAESVARHIVNLPTHRRIPLARLVSLWRRHGDWLQAQLLPPPQR